ncbi:MAG: hypothetical protein LBG81_08845 [Coriobacteriaceae bacterium]|nr:hypothetical protein [Coriobacteriaceae bacterium]
MAPGRRTNDQAEPYLLNEALEASLEKRMGEWVIAACKAKRLAFAQAFPFVVRPLSAEAVISTALQNAGIGFVAFLPGADLPVMTLNQAKMLLQVAAAYGQEMSLARAKELAVVIGGAFVCRSLARQLVAFVPALGWVIKAGVGFSGTLAMGFAAIEYFERGGSPEGLPPAMAKVRNKALCIAGTVLEQPFVAQALAKAQSIGAQLTHKASGPTPGM